MMLPRFIAHPLALGCALGALIVIGCGGPNMSDNDRRPTRLASDTTEGKEKPEAEDEDDEEELAPAEVPDAGPPAPIPDAAPEAAPIPAGSFAAGTELDTTANLNMRLGPGVEFDIIVEIPLGTRVKVDKTSGADGWVNVLHDGKTGFCSKDFLAPVP
jgi:hypothetical protein